MPRLDLGLPGLFCLLILSGFSGLGVAPRRYSAIVRVSDASNNKQRDETMRLSYSRMNQIWFLLWNGQVIDMYETREQAVVDLRYKGLTVGRQGKVTTVN